MSLREVAQNLLVAVVVSSVFSISLKGCGWSPNEIFAVAAFFVVAASVSILASALTPRWWAVLIAVLVMPVIGAWLYGLSLLFSPGELSVGPCVERSTWTAFPALYLAASCAAILNRSFWQRRAIAATVFVITLAAAVLLLRNLF